jgi:hypothetical protein
MASNPGEGNESTCPVTPANWPPPHFCFGLETLQFKSIANVLEFVPSGS